MRSARARLPIAHDAQRPGLAPVFQFFLPQCGVFAGCEHQPAPAALPGHQQDDMPKVLRLVVAQTMRGHVVQASPVAATTTWHLTQYLGSAGPAAWSASARSMPSGPVAG